VATADWQPPRTGGVRQAVSEAGLVVKLEKVIERLRAGTPDMARPGADL
jgi:hypothetical protein